MRAARVYIVKPAAADAAELLVLVPGGVWAPIEFLPRACRFDPDVAARLRELPAMAGAVVVRAACDCARCVRVADLRRLGGEL